MAGEVKATWFFKSTTAGTAVGWTESLWHKTGGIDLAEALDAARILAKRRQSFLGGGYTIDFVRVSREGVFRDSFIAQLNYSGMGGNQADSDSIGDFAYAVALLRMESGPLHRRSMYISGVPDSLQQINGTPIGGPVAGAFSEWADVVKATWAWFGLVVDAGTNKATRTYVAQPKPHYTYPNGRTLYPISKVIIRRFGNRKRGRPFGLLRGRLKAPKPAHP